MIRWGVVGPGAIATGFADAMQLTDGGTIVAVASRSAERADAFGDRYAIPARYGDYESLAADPDVDVVYVATPQSRHESDTLSLPARREARPVREALRAQRAAGGHDDRGGTEPGPVPDGGDLEPLPPGVPLARRGHRGGPHR